MMCASRSGAQRFRERSGPRLAPVIQPGGEASAEVTRTLCKKDFGQLGGVPLQVALAHLNQGEQLMSLALPICATMLRPKTLAQKAQIMGLPQQFA